MIKLPCSLAPFLFLAVVSCAPDRDRLTVAGTIEIRDVQVAALAPGRLARLLRDEGDTVLAGDTLAILAQPGLDDRIGEARARHAAARARVADLEAGARRQELATARAALDAAQADSLRAVRDLARYRQLAADSIATASQLEAAVTAAETAVARVTQAREQLDLVAAGPRAQQLTAARREAEALAAGVAALEAQRRDLVLTAPADGIVLLRLAEEGEALGAGVPVLTVGLTRRPWIRAFVGHAVIGRVAVGAVVVVRVGDTTFPGRVSEINPRAEFIPRAALTERERADLVYGITVAIDDHDGRLKAGMPVDLEITLLP